MFNNLIESSSHFSEFKRRGSFFLFTTATYLLLFVVAGVMSIYAYDARLEEPSSEIIMLSPLELKAPETVPIPDSPAPKHASTTKRQFVERAVAMASVNRPDVVPETTSAKPNKNLPVPDTGRYKITGSDSDPLIPGGPGTEKNRSGANSGSDGQIPSVDVGTPPPLPVEKPKPRIVHKRVLNGEAISLPKPPYPPLAKQMRIQGAVNVQVLVDENGNVISAKVISGSPALVSAAQRAAMQARFSPTLLGEQPVKVSGVITYNFLLQ